MAYFFINMIYFEILWRGYIFIHQILNFYQSVPLNRVFADPISSTLYEPIGQLNHKRNI